MWRTNDDPVLKVLLVAVVFRIGFDACRISLTPFFGVVTEDTRQDQVGPVRQ